MGSLNTRWLWWNETGFGASLGAPLDMPYDPNGWTLRMLLQMLRAFTSISYRRRPEYEFARELSIWFGVGTVLFAEHTIYLSFWPNFNCSPNGGLVFLYVRTFYLRGCLHRIKERLTA